MDLSICFQCSLAIAAVLAVDFISGLVHWAEDTFGTVDTPIVGRWIVAPNVLHHHDASAFVGRSWFASSWDLLLASSVVAALAWLSGVLCWPVVLMCVVGANANQIHKWNHLGESHTPRFVHVLWWTGVLQRPAHHLGHHQGATNLRYCVVTPFVNPLLDRIGFWPGLERVLVPIFGASRRADIVLRSAARRAASTSSDQTMDSRGRPAR